MKNNNLPKKIENKRFRVEITTFLGSNLKSRWYATKEEAEDWSYQMSAKTATYFEESVIGYKEFEKFGRVFRSEIWG